MTEKIIVGNQEWCAFPELGLPAVKARIDSGAKTSSLHAWDIETFYENEIKMARFIVHPLQRDLSVTLACQAPVVDRRAVKSSSGIAQTRTVIATTLSLGGVEWPVELTLTNRDSMRYRMLLGRQAMADRILIDPSLAFQQGKVPPSRLRKFYR